MYLVNQDFDWSQATDWLKENVLPKLYAAWPQHDLIRKVPKNELRDSILDFLTVEAEATNQKLKLVGISSAYDFVCTAQRFGLLINKPRVLPWWNCDLRQWVDDFGNPRLPEKQVQHNALLDARWVRDSYEWLSANYEHPAWTPRLRLPLKG